MIKCMLLFWAWKLFGEIAEGFFKIHEYFYNAWGRNVTPPLQRVSIRDAMIRTVENALMWKRNTDDFRLASEIVDEMVRYVPTLLVKGPDASLSNRDLPEAPDALD